MDEKEHRACTPIDAYDGVIRVALKFLRLPQNRKTKGSQTVLLSITLMLSKEAIFDALFVNAIYQ